MITFKEFFNKSILSEAINKEDVIDDLKARFKEEQEEWGTTLYEFIDELPEIDLEEVIPKIYSDFFGDPTEYNGGVYHQTTEEYKESILKNGINASNKTRGISNRGVGSAVFTSYHIDEMGSYGDVTFSINLGVARKMNPDITTGLEPPIEEKIRKGQLYNILSGGEYEEYHIDSSDGLSEDTLIVYGHIPPEAIEIVE